MTRPAALLAAILLTACQSPETPLTFQRATISLHRLEIPPMTFLSIRF